MPVRYDIAAGLAQPQQSYSPMNMLAQMQAMDYREQQNALAQAQLAEYQRRVQAEAAMRGLASEPGFNIADPRLVGRAFELGGPEEGVRIANAQRQLAALQAQQKAQQATGEYHTGMLDLARQKLPLEQEKLRAEAAKEARAGKKLDLEINKEALDRDAKTLEKMENVAAKVYNTNGRGYDSFRQMAVKEHPEFENILPPEYDADILSGFIDNAASTRERLKSAADYEYREVTDATGATRIVAIPKRSPQAGAIPVPGAEGQKAKALTAMPGAPDTGTIVVFNPATGESEVRTPRQPGADITPGPRMPLTAAAAPAAGRLIPSEIRPTAEAPVGSAAYNNKRFATEVLDASGFNAETGEDRVSSLIRKSTSGGLQASGAGIRGFFGTAPKGMEAIGEIKTIINDAILKKLNGKLGAGISNEDREFIKSTLGNLDDPSIPANQRLASWNSAKRILMKYANTGGSPASSTGAAANRPSLDEIFK